MKRVFLVHGWGGGPLGGWLPWLKGELEKKDFSVTAPAMPEPDFPKQDAWVGRLSETVGAPDKECFFVGHSLGCITILRYLETIESRVGGAVLVAGFSDNLGFAELDDFFRKPIDWEKIKSNCGKVVAVHSDNDPYVPLEHGEIFREKLGANLVVKPGMKHFSGDEGMTSLPAVLDSVLNIAGR